MQNDSFHQNDSRRSARRLYTRIRWPLGRNLTFVLGSFVAAYLAAYTFGDPSFTDAQQHTVFTLVFAVLLWLTEAIPPFAVGLFIICFQLLAFGTPLINSEPIDAQMYLNTWSSSVIFLMLGGFFLADGMKKVGVDRDVLRLSIRLFGRRPGRMLLGLMLTTTALSMVMSNTATVAMMITAVLPFLKKDSSSVTDRNFSKAVLLGVPAAAAVGGMGTIIGSPPNAVAVGALEQAGVHVTFLNWMLLGAPLSIVLCIGFWASLRRKYPWGSREVEIDLHGSASPDGRLFGRIVVIATTGVTMLLWLTSSLHSIPVATISAVPVAILTLTGVLEAPDMRKLPWDTLMLVAGGLSLGLAIVEEGVAEYYLGQIDLQGASRFALIVAFGYISVSVSNVMSNTAAASILIPISAVMLGGSAGIIPAMIAVSASAAMFLPVSTPPNAIAYSTGMVDAKDFRFGGLLIGATTPLLAAAWVWVLSLLL